MSFFDKVWKRAQEPSTYAGLALVAGGINQIGDVNEAGQAASFLGALAQGIVPGAGWMGVLMAALGAFAVMKGEGHGRR